MWGYSLAFWQSVVVVTMWLAFASAVVSGTAALVSSWVGWKISGLEQADADRRIKEAGASAERASAEVAKAQAAIAQANAETARANERTAELKLALEREVAARLPRTISSEQAGALAALLKDVPKGGPVYVVPDWVDAEAKLFAAQIERVLRDIGYSVGPLTHPDKPLSYGKLGAFFVIRDRNALPEHLAPLYNGFKRIGFDFVIYEEKYVPLHGVMIGVSTK